MVVSSYHVLGLAAAQEGHESVAKLLLAGGADPNRADGCGRTALKVTTRNLSLEKWISFTTSHTLQNYSKDSRKILERYSKDTRKILERYSKDTRKILERYSKDTDLKNLKKIPSTWRLS